MAGGSRIGTATASGVFGAVADLGKETGETLGVSVARGLAAKAACEAPDIA
jgi:hypothetical protein